MQEPGERDLSRSRVVGGGDAPDRVVPALRKRPLQEREPGDEGDPGLLARAQQVLVLAVGEVVAILDSCDRDDSARLFELREIDVRDSDMLDLALRLQLGQGADRLLERHVGIWDVEVVERDRLQPQPPQAGLASSPKMLRSAVGPPLERPVPKVAALGGEHELRRIGMERLRDELLAHVRPVGIRGVDDVDAKVNRLAQHRTCRLAIRRSAPDPGPGDPHRPESDPLHRSAGQKRRRRWGLGQSRLLGDRGGRERLLDDLRTPSSACLRRRERDRRARAARAPRAPASEQSESRSRRGSPGGRPSCGRGSARTSTRPPGTETRTSRAPGHPCRAPRRSPRGRAIAPPRGSPPRRDRRR